MFTLTGNEAFLAFFSIGILNLTRTYPDSTEKI